MADLLSIIGMRIRLLRKERGWSQERLAELADLNASYVGKIERGEKNVTFKSLEKVAAALEIPIEELFRQVQSVNAELDSNTLLSIIHLMQFRSVEEQKKALQLLELVLNWHK